jgi:hypothetical protein
MFKIQLLIIFLSLLFVMLLVIILVDFFRVKKVNVVARHWRYFWSESMTWVVWKNPEKSFVKTWWNCCSALAANNQSHNLFVSFTPNYRPLSSNEHQEKRQWLLHLLRHWLNLSHVWLLSLCMMFSQSYTRLNSSFSFISKFRLITVKL